MKTLGETPGLSSQDLTPGSVKSSTLACGSPLFFVYSFLSNIPPLISELNRSRKIKTIVEEVIDGKVVATEVKEIEEKLPSIMQAHSK